MLRYWEVLWSAVCAVQMYNIDLMNLAGFYGNCFSKWNSSGAQERGIDMNYQEAHQVIWGMAITTFAVCGVYFKTKSYEARNCFNMRTNLLIE